MKSPTIIFVLCIIVFSILLWNCQSQRADFYVAPDGEDNNPGTLTKPFATLEQVKAAVQDKLEENPNSNITVMLRGGTYSLTETVVFGPKDSPSGKGSVTYKAYSDEKPILSSGVRLDNWQQPEKNLTEFPLVAQDKVWTTDLDKHIFCLFNKEECLPRARSTGFSPTIEADDWQGDKQTLFFPGKKLKNWSNLQDVEIFIRPSRPWTVNMLQLASVDETRGMAKTTLSGTYALTRLKWSRTDASKTCWVENVPKALDEPGEWILNTDENRLYYWPKDGIPNAHIYYPALTELIKISGDEQKNTLAKNIILDGLTFMHGDRNPWSQQDAGLQHDWDMFDKPNALLRLRYAENCIIKNCHFTNSGGAAIRLDLHCQNNKILQNKIEYMGGTGILLAGYGPGIKDVNKNNTVAFNHIHHCGRIYWHAPAIFVWQSGENLIKNNLIHNMPYSGIVVSGVRPGFFNPENKGRREIVPTIRWDEIGTAREWAEILPFLHARNNRVEKNEIHHVMEKLDDGNGIYVSGAGEGNVLRKNYIHHLVDLGAQSGIRCDDYQKGTLITENVVYKCVYGGMILKHVNDITNNIFADMIEQQDSPEGNVPLNGYILFRRGPIAGSVIKHNIFYHRGGHIRFYEENKGRVPAFLKNCKADSNLFYTAQAPDSAKQYLKSKQKEGVEQNSLVADPMFVDFEEKSFKLQKDSPAFKIGFKQIDLSNVGLREEYK